LRISTAATSKSTARRVRAQQLVSCCPRGDLHGLFRIALHNVLSGAH
jgi:hypothetical protein